MTTSILQYYQRRSSNQIENGFVGLQLPSASFTSRLYLTQSECICVEGLPLVAVTLFSKASVQVAGQQGSFPLLLCPTAPLKLVILPHRDVTVVAGGSPEWKGDQTSVPCFPCSELSGNQVVFLLQVGLCLLWAWVGPGDVGNLFLSHLSNDSAWLCCFPLFL